MVAKERITIHGACGYAAAMADDKWRSRWCDAERKCELGTVFGYPAGTWPSVRGSGPARAAGDNDDGPAAHAPSANDGPVTDARRTVA